MDLLLSSEHIAVDVSDERGLTPLHEACISGDVLIVRALLAKHAAVDVAALDGKRPLHEACKVAERSEKLKRALFTKPSHGTESSTFEHCLAESEQIVRVLLDCHATVNCQDSTGRTPLHEACRTKSLDMVLSLLAGQARVDVVDGRGMSPLHEACGIAGIDRNKPDDAGPIVRALLEHHTDVIALDAAEDSGLSDGESSSIPIFTTAGIVSCRPLSMCALLKLNATLMGTALTRAILFRADNVALVQCLLDYGADPTSRNEEEQTAMHSLPKLRRRRR